MTSGHDSRSLLRDWAIECIANDSFHGALKTQMLFHDPFVPVAAAMDQNNTPSTLFSAVCERHLSDCGANPPCIAHAALAISRVLVMEQREIFEYRRSSTLKRAVRFDDRSPAFSFWNEQQAVKQGRRFVSRIPCVKLRVQVEEELGDWLTFLGSDAPVAQQDNKCHHSNEECSRDRPVVRITGGAVEEASGMRANDEEGGVFLLRPVPPFTPLIRVPAAELFHIDLARAHCAFCHSLEAAFPDGAAKVIDDESLLLLCLVFEMFVVGPRRSQWAALLRGIPRNFDIVPTKWPDSDLLELEGCAVLDEVVSKRERLAAFTEEVRSLVAVLLTNDSAAAPLLAAAAAANHADASGSASSVHNAFSLEHLHWARAAIDSRAFYLNHSGEVLLTLAPVADMLNHSLQTMVLARCIDDASGDFVLEGGPALGPECVGREVFMCYGPLQSWELLLSYGFTLLTPPSEPAACDAAADGGNMLVVENENDRFPFPVVIDDADVQDGDAEAEDEWEARRRAIRNAHMLRAPSELFLARDGSPSPTLTALLRLQLAEAEEFPSLEADPFAAVSDAVEQKVIDVVRSGVEAVMANFPSSLDDDRRVLENARASRALPLLSRNAHCAVALRYSLKLLGVRALRWCDAAAGVGGESGSMVSTAV